MTSDPSAAAFTRVRRAPAGSPKGSMAASASTTVVPGSWEGSRPMPLALSRRQAARPAGLDEHSISDGPAVTAMTATTVTVAATNVRAMFRRCAGAAKVSLPNLPNAARNTQSDGGRGHLGLHQLVGDGFIKCFE